MACLQYSPAPVVFAQKTYNRSDLLGVRERLLTQAPASASRAGRARCMSR